MKEVFGRVDLGMAASCGVQVSGSMLNIENGMSKWDRGAKREDKEYK